MNISLLSNATPRISECYFHRRTRSIADLVLLNNYDMLITRINVPIQYRMAGLGSKILREICKDADRQRVNLVVEPVASGGLTQKSLTDWYERHGFVWVENGVMYRRFRAPLVEWEVDKDIERTRNDV